jgi:ORF6N domain
MADLIPIERIESKILLIRGKKILLDSDLAVLYDVSVGRLNEAVKRKIKRFPANFMFQLNNKEFTDLKSQFAIANVSRGGRRTPPYAFTEQGVAMLSSVLNSERAIQVNITIMNTLFKCVNCFLIMLKWQNN